VIRVEFEAPPIPVRTHDWRACVDGEEELIAYGGSKEEALMNLCELVTNKYFDHFPCYTKCGECGLLRECK
jgi:hypothetical protein